MANYNYVPSEQVKLQQRMAEELMNTPMRQGLRGGQPTDWGRGLAHMLRLWQGGKQLREAKDQQKFNTGETTADMAQLLKNQQIPQLNAEMEAAGQAGPPQAPNTNFRTPEGIQMGMAQQLRASEREQDQAWKMEQIAKRNEGYGQYQGVTPKEIQIFQAMTGKEKPETADDATLLYRITKNVKVRDTGLRHEEVDLPTFDNYFPGQGQIEQTFSPTERQKFDFGQPTQYTPTGNSQRLGVDKTLKPEQDLGYLAELAAQEATIKKEADIAKNTANAAIDDLIKVQMPKAKSNVTILRSIGNARKLLDEGIRTGSFANLRQDFGRMINTVGFSYNEDATTNTDTFIAEAGTRVGQVITAFGSGTGLSDEDREYAEKMSAGKIAVTKESLYKILEIHEKAARIEIEQYNKRAGAIKDSPYLLTVELPPMTGGQDIDSLLNLY